MVVLPDRLEDTEMAELSSLSLSGFMGTATRDRGFTVSPGEKVAAELNKGSARNKHQDFKTNMEKIFFLGKTLLFDWNQKVTEISQICSTALQFDFPSD